MSEENVETGAAGLTTPLRSERQASAVRRQADTHRDVASLAKLLSEVRDDCGHLTAEWWVGLWKLGDGGAPRARRVRKDDGSRSVAQALWGSVGLDPDIPATDLDALRHASATVIKHVDRHIAHSEDPGPVPEPRLDAAGGDHDAQ
jgi:hypothetical protein